MLEDNHGSVFTSIQCVEICQKKKQVLHKEQTHKIMDFNGAHANQINEMKISIWVQRVDN